MKGTVPSKKRLSTIPEGGNYSAVRRDVKMTGRQMRDAVRDEAVATSSSQSIKASQSNTEPLSVLSKGKIWLICILKSLLLLWHGESRVTRPEDGRTSEEALSQQAVGKAGRLPAWNSTPEIASLHLFEVRNPVANFSLLPPCALHNRAGILQFPCQLNQRHRR